MFDFLKTIFGANIDVSEFDYPDKTPFFIRDGYKIQILSWKKSRCVLLSPIDSSWRLPTLKKQLTKFQEICDFPCALCLENITSKQRRNLIESNIPFISPSQQVYLPFWGCSFLEKFKAETTVPDKMAPGTQLVFLYLYYLKTTNTTNLTQISKELSLSKATCTRAIDDLTASGLITCKTEGTNKWIAPAFEKPEFLKKGYPRLKSPVERLIYVRASFHDAALPKSGVIALADISMVGADEQDGAAAISKKGGAGIPAAEIISEQDFRDFGGRILEVWRYDPTLLANGGRVDDISLLLSLEDNPNERIQMGLDDIREKHELPIKYEE